MKTRLICAAAVAASFVAHGATASPDEVVVLCGRDEAALSGLIVHEVQMDAENPRDAYDFFARGIDCFDGE